MTCMMFTPAEIRSTCQALLAFDRADQKALPTAELDAEVQRIKDLWQRIKAMAGSLEAERADYVAAYGEDATLDLEREARRMLRSVQYGVAYIHAVRKDRSPSVYGSWLPADKK